MCHIVICGVPNSTISHKWHEEEEERNEEEKKEEEEKKKKTNIKCGF